MDFHHALETLFGHPCVPLAVDPFKSDASDRQYYRLTLPPQMDPRSLIAMVTTDDDAGVNRSFVNVQHHFAAAGLRVPQIYLEHPRDGLILLEDLGRQSLAEVVPAVDGDTVRDWYGAAVDLLAGMHDRLWPVPEECVAATRLADTSFLRHELAHYQEWGLEERLDRPPDSAPLLRLAKAFDRFAVQLASLPLGFAHRDYQSRNLMILGEPPGVEQLAIIDFQDSFVAPRVYDLVALLNDSYVELPQSLIEEMIARYATLRGIDRGILTEEFHQLTIQRKLKDAGRFIFLDRVKGKPGFLKFVDGTLQRVRTSLSALGDHQELKTALAQADPEWFG